jgi:hypothetical protein
LRGRSNKQLGSAVQSAAEANARAAEANLALARYAAPRLILDEQADRMVEALRPFSGMQFCCATQSSDPEQLVCLASIQQVLIRAGWSVVDWTGGGQVQRNFPGDPAIGFGVSVSDVVIGVPMQSWAALQGPVAALNQALIATAGIVAIARPAPTVVYILQIMVGPKRTLTSNIT